MKPLLAVSLCLIILSGCASATGSSTQNISVQSQDKFGNQIIDVSCELSNSKGKWLIKTPETIAVNRSLENMMVKCSKDGLENGTAEAVSSTKVGLLGNLLFGGIIGAGLDSSTGSAYEYPNSLDIVMGASTTIDKDKLIANGTLHNGFKVIVYTGQVDAIVLISEIPKNSKDEIVGKIVSFCGADAGTTSGNYRIGQEVSFKRNEVKNIIID